MVPALTALRMTRSDWGCRHLGRLFREELGTTPAQWLEQLQLAKAQELILVGYTVTAAARNSGFGSGENLRRALSGDCIRLRRNAGRGSARRLGEVGISGLACQPGLDIHQCIQGERADLPGEQIRDLGLSGIEIADGLPPLDQSGLSSL